MNVEKLKELYRHNKPFAIAIIIAIGLGIWFFGCESMTTSPFNPGQKVTREQLIIQIETYKRNVELAFTDLDKQDLFKQKLAEIGLAIAEGGTVNPAGVVMSLLGVLGIGAVASNRQKDSLLRDRDNKLKALTAKINLPLN